MARVCAPDGACKQITVHGRTYTARRGIFDVPDHAARRMIRDGECFKPLTRANGRGYRCERCKFTSVFRRCGRCGAADLPEES